MNSFRLLCGSFRWYLAVAIIAAWAWPVCARDDAHFRFVQISDTHWGSMDSLAVTRAFVEEINALPLRIEFVVHTGDILSDNIDRESIVAEGKAIMAGLKAPVYYVPGNHDFSPRITNAVELYTRHFGPVNHRADRFGVRCIFWGSAYGKGLAAAGGVDAFTWLERELKEAGRRPVLIFQHAPAVEDFYNNTLHDGWADDAYRRWVRLLKDADVRAVVTGHFHRDELHWIGDVPVYVTTPVVRYFDRQPSYRIYEYRNGRLAYTTQYREVRKNKGTAPGKSDPAVDAPQPATKRGSE